MPRIWLRMTDLLLSSTNRQTTPRGNRARASAPVFGTGTIRTNAANNQRIPKHRSSDAAPIPLAQSVDPLRARRCLSAADLGRDAVGAADITCRRTRRGGRNAASRRRAADSGAPRTAGGQRAIGAVFKAGAWREKTGHCDAATRFDDPCFDAIRRCNPIRTGSESREAATETSRGSDPAATAPQNAADQNNVDGNRAAR